MEDGAPARRFGWKVIPGWNCGDDGELVAEQTISKSIAN